MNDKASTTVDIAPNGDVVFIVGPRGKRLKVYSLFLTTASPVFNAMLSPSFKEGSQLAQPGSSEIELPEDNAEAIEIVFNVIHGHNNMVEDKLGSETLLQVAKIVDKYDCFNSLAFAIQTWLKWTNAKSTLSAYTDGPR